MNLKSLNLNPIAINVAKALVTSISISLLTLAKSEDLHTRRPLGLKFVSLTKRREKSRNGRMFTWENSL